MSWGQVTRLFKAGGSRSYIGKTKCVLLGVLIKPFIFTEGTHIDRSSNTRNKVNMDDPGITASDTFFIALIFFYTVCRCG